MVDALSGKPMPGTLPSIYVANASDMSLTGSAQPYPIPLTNAGDFMLGVALGATNGGDVGVATFEANLNVTNPPPTIYARSVAASALTSLTVADLGATPVPVLANLPIISQGSARWQSYVGKSDNLLATGAIYPNGNGLNFMWWNGAGALLAERVGTNAFLYSAPDAGTPPVVGTDIMLTGAPNTLIASFEVAYLLEEPDDGGTDFVAWANQVDCQGPGL